MTLTFIRMGDFYEAFDDDARALAAALEVGLTSVTPKRVQLRRTKGWRMPPNTVKVDRRTRWGNHIVVGSERGIGYHPWTAQEAVEQYREDIEAAICEDRPDGSEPLDLSPLRGKNLACWCKLSAPCHADVLLALANSGGTTAMCGVPVHAAESYFNRLREAGHDIDIHERPDGQRRK